jgi:hypothetical protein
MLTIKVSHNPTKQTVKAEVLGDLTNSRASAEIMESFAQALVASEDASVAEAVAVYSLLRYSGSEFGVAVVEA